MNGISRNKRLGQFFSGTELAKILGQIAQRLNPNISSVIDPMMGRGDMLLGFDAIAQKVEKFGVEIDNELREKVMQTLGDSATIFFGDSFDTETFSKLGKWQFDLVLTNPPYVRHLNQKRASSFGSFVVPSDQEIRANLLKMITSNKALKDEERHVLSHLTKHYPRNADSSVPSIIHCSALTKEDGVIALVLPESCLAREYSVATLIALFKLFEISVIVKDEYRSWFDDAQVKTLLVIGKKLSVPRASILDHPEITVVEVGAAGSHKALPLGKSVYSANYAQFAEDILNNVDVVNLVDGFNAYRLSASSLIDPLLMEDNAKALLSALDTAYDSKAKSDDKTRVNLDSRLENEIGCSNWKLIEDLGVIVNQGLRTGANKFFYCDLLEGGETASQVETKLKDEVHPISVPNTFLRTVLRKQNELPSGYGVSNDILDGRVLILEGHFTAADVRAYRLPEERYNVLGTALSSYIEKCEATNIGTEAEPKFVQNLSAVRTNAQHNNGTHRSWYHLPKLQERHLPKLCVPRVNSALVKSFLLEDEVVVDANFITVNLDQNAGIDATALLAILNSSWTKLQLELSGIVLGGGALKLDRTHIRNLRIPTQLLERVDQLSELGGRLVSEEEPERFLVAIDNLINGALELKSESVLLENLLQSKLKHRKKKNV